jgi:hypothetical protein
MRDRARLPAVALAVAGCYVLMSAPARAASQPATVTAAPRCSISGYGQSDAYVTCPGYDVYVKVWCTWGGSGHSVKWRPAQNWAGCSRGTIHTESDGIEVLTR